MTARDPFELLRRLEPRSHRSTDHVPDAALLARVMVTPVTARRRRRFRRGAWIAGIFAIATGGAAVTWAVTHTEVASDPLGVACASSMAPDAATFAVSPSADPREACAALWRDGTLGTGEPPALDACVSATGLARVVPGPAGTCAELALAALADASGTAPAAVARLDAAVTAALRDRCLTEDEATRFIEMALEDPVYSGWQLEPANPFTTARPCAIDIIDPAEKIIYLGGGPDQSP